MKDSVKDRLKFYLKHNDIKAIDFCKSIGVSSGFISGMRESIQPDKLKSIAINYPLLDIGWLMTGIGEMEKTTSPNLEIIESLKAENNMLRGENRVLREQLGLGERKVSSGRSA